MHEKENFLKRPSSGNPVSDSCHSFPVVNHIFSLFVRLSGMIVYKAKNGETRSGKNKIRMLYFLFFQGNFKINVKVNWKILNYFSEKKLQILFCNNFIK